MGSALHVVTIIVDHSNEGAELSRCTGPLNAQDRGYLSGIRANSFLGNNAAKVSNLLADP